MEILLARHVGWNTVDNVYKKVRDKTKMMDVKYAKNQIGTKDRSYQMNPLRQTINSPHKMIKMLMRVRKMPRKVTKMLTKLTRMIGLKDHQPNLRSPMMKMVMTKIKREK